MNNETLKDGTSLVPGQTYTVKMRGKGTRTQARFEYVHVSAPFGNNARATKTYRFTNLATGREIMTRSKQVIFKANTGS